MANVTGQHRGLGDLAEYNVDYKMPPSQATILFQQLGLDFAAKYSLKVYKNDSLIGELNQDSTESSSIHVFVNFGQPSDEFVNDNGTWEVNLTNPQPDDGSGDTMRFEYSAAGKMAEGIAISLNGRLRAEVSRNSAEVIGKSDVTVSGVIETDWFLAL